MGMRGVSQRVQGSCPFHSEDLTGNMGSWKTMEDFFKIISLLVAASVDS
jgi:hypothetical protein